MKKLAAAVLVAAPILASAANGPLDGIYVCVARLGNTDHSAFVTVNGYPDGNSIFGVMAIATTQTLLGYGIGQVANTVYTGRTSSGGSFIFNTTSTSMTGTVGILFNGQMVNAPVNCNRFW